MNQFNIISNTWRANKIYHLSSSMAVCFGLCSTLLVILAARQLTATAQPRAHEIASKFGVSIYRRILLKNCITIFLVVIRLQVVTL